jgi:NADH-quinone oxidoreductase subunit I
MIRIKFPRPRTIENVRLHIDALLVGAREAIKPGTVTIEYPRERRLLPDHFRGYIIFSANDCISCFQCSFVCPANAISMKLSKNRYYPSIDYAKCIFCHYCVDSCPRGALRPTKIHDVVYAEMSRMIAYPEEMVSSPEILREDEYTVEYVIKRDLMLRRTRERDNLIPKFEVPKVVKEYSACESPESCLGCGLCEKACPSEAITMLEEKEEKILRIEKEKCTGCGICVRVCPVQILSMKRG